MFIGKLTKSHRSWRENNNAKNNINEYCDKKPIRTLGNMFQEMGQSKDNSTENESSTKTESQSGTESSHINTVVEIHKCDSKRKKYDKRHYDNDVDKMNEKNSNGTQTEKNDNQKIEFSKFRRQTMKLKNMFVPGIGTKESQESETNNKDVEKADEFVPTKKLKQSKISDEDKDSEFSRIEEISEDSSADRISKKSYQNPRRLIFKSNQNNNENQSDQNKSETPSNKSVGVQATPFPPFRLHFLPEEDWRETDNKVHKLLKIVLCQCGLACIVLTWAMLGALVFRLTEGPQEQRQVQEMARQQASLVVGLATDLRQVVPQEPIWRQTIERYANQHEALILSAVSSGYPQRGTIWTYPGSLLFATSLLTTLGFGAPVPRTVVGRMSAIIFAGLGIPMHLLLVLNIGLLIVVKLTRLAYICQGKMKFLKFKIHKVKTRGDSEQNSTPEWPNELFVTEKQIPPTWLRYFPFVAIPTYYLTGFLLFGVARGKEFPEVFLFPLDFTAAGGVASTYGHLRIAYAMYLEGAVILASTNVALLRVSATRGFTTAAIKLGLMTNSLH